MNIFVFGETVKMKSLK